MIEPKDSIKIDAKWFAYVLNYDKKVSNSTQNYTAISVLECDVSIGEVYTNTKDTIYYVFNFYKVDKDKRLIPENGHIEAIGVSLITKNMFPKHNAISFANSISRDFWNSYFKDHETLFLDFIKKYDGIISSTLKNELERKRLNSSFPN